LLFSLLRFIAADQQLTATASSIDTLVHRQGGETSRILQRKGLEIKTKCDVILRDFDDVIIDFLEV